MKIGIIGTRGIPNRYGGFEECAEQLGVRLVQKGHEVVVYNSHLHPFSGDQYSGVKIVRRYDPEHRIGTFGQFVYDLNCILDARKRNFDLLLMLGYTSSSVWQRFLPRKARIITNMDGLEWKRSKYSNKVQQFLKLAESWAARGSQILIADAHAIKSYLEQKYSTTCIYIPYGAKIFRQPEPAVLKKYAVEPGQYNLVIARLEPENNLELILNGILESRSEQICLVIGNNDTAYGTYLKEKFRDSRIRFLTGNFDKDGLNNLRYFSNIYFHGHSVGGTNPSLLEAMACSCMICAHDNTFNREVLGDNAMYFNDRNDVSNAVDLLERNEIQRQKIKNNLERIETIYNWESVTDQYEMVMQQALLGS